MVFYIFKQSTTVLADEELHLDTAQVNFVNHFKNSTVYVWTHYQECYKCGYFPVPSVLKVNETFEKQFLTYYTLKYAVTTGNRSDLGILCNGTVAAQDQSFHNLTYVFSVLQPNIKPTFYFLELITKLILQQTVLWNSPKLVATTFGRWSLYWPLICRWFSSFILPVTTTKGKKQI